MATLTVGSDQQFQRIADAIKAANDGDVVEVQAGTYYNDFATIDHKITIKGVGGLAHVIATEPPPDGKAILTTNTDVTIDHLELSGAAVGDQNGSGIRYQGGTLNIVDSYIHDNQEGLLGTPLAPGQGTINILRSEFSHNGAGDGQSHNIYVNQVAALNIDQSYFHDAVVGHEIKSRAERTTITNSRIQNGPNGSGSYVIDLPNGGDALIQGNVIEQGPLAQNPNMVAFGEEGNLRSGTSLRVVGNTFINDLPSGSARGVWNAAGATATLSGNAIFGLSADQITRGPADVSGTTILAAAPGLDASSPIGANVMPTPGGGQPAPDPTPAPQPDPTPAPSPQPPAVPGSTVTLSPGETTQPTGSGAALRLQMSGDSYQGDAKFVVSVDGARVGGVYAVTAQHAAGESQTFALPGSYEIGSHSIAIAFINDLWDPGVGDRNLYVDSVTLNGTLNGAAKAALYSNGAADLRVSTIQGPPADTLVLHLSEQMFQSDAQFVVSVDGQQLGGARTVTASRDAGQAQDITLTGRFGPGAHDVALRLLNDPQTGVPGAALCLDGMDFNGTLYGAGQPVLVSGDTTHFLLPGHA